MPEEEKKQNNWTAIRETIVAKYTKDGLSEKDAAEKADAFIREHVFNPNAAKLDPQMVGLTDRAAEAARQQAEEKAAPAAVPAEQEKAAPAEKAAEEEVKTEVKDPVEEEKDGKESAAPAAKAKDGKEAEEDVPVFSAGPDKSAVKENQDENADLDELKEQLLRTAWKNKFLALEDEEANEGLADDKKHKCPFGQCLPDSIKINKDPAYATMKTEKGSTLLNASKRVHMDYEGDKPSFEDCIAMARLGMEKGWKTAKLEGSEEYKAQMYLAMRAMGIKAIGYTPSPELEKQGDELAAQYKQDREHAESMDQRYPALDKARDGMDFKSVNIEKYKEIRAKAEGKDTAGQTKDAKEAEAPAAEKPAKEAEAPAAEKTAKEAEAPSVGKAPEVNKAELNGKFNKMVATLREQHPNVAKPVDFKGKSPADLLKAYGNALTVVKKTDAKESAKAASNALNAVRNRSGEGR